MTQQPAPRTQQPVYYQQQPKAYKDYTKEVKLYRLFFLLITICSAFGSAIMFFGIRDTGSVFEIFVFNLYLVIALLVFILILSFIPLAKGIID